MNHNPHFTLSYRLVSFISAVLLVFNLVLTPVGWSASTTENDIHFTSLASGQQIYIQEIHTQPIVTIDTWVNTGSAQETAANNGVSHFLEHLLFKGTQKYKLGEIDRILESRGAEFNAATSDDFTHYHITTASPYFKEALELHADMLLNATINPQELDRERKVVQEEINRSLDNPFRKGYIAMSKLMFDAHPYAMDTLGPKSNIQNIPREDILSYYHRWYQPENFRTVVVGDIKTDEAVDLVNQAFNKAFLAQPRPKAGQAALNPVSTLSQPKSAIIVDPNLSAVRWQLGFMAPPVTKRQDNYALDIAAMVLGQGASSRLYQNLKEKQQLVTDVSAGNSTMQQAGMFFVGAEVKPENLDKAKQAVLAEIARFKSEGPTPEELAKAKTQVVKQFAFATESTQGVAESIGYNVTIAQLEDYTAYVNNIQKITAAQVKEAAGKYLDFGKAVLVEVTPGDGKSADNSRVAANVAFLKDMAKNSQTSTVANKANDTDSTAKPDITVMRLPSGTKLLLKPSPTTKTVALALFAKGGRLSEPKPGVAALTGRVLTKGTKNRTAEEISRELESLGLALGASSDEDYMQVTGASISDDFNKLLLVLQDVLANPTFPQDELDKERAQMLEEIKTSRDQPSSLMFEKLTENLYDSHPYGAIGERLEASLPGISRDDLIRFYQQQFTPDNLVITVVGNFNPQQVQTALKQVLADLPDKTRKSENLPDVPPLKQDILVEAKKPEQAATWLAYGWLGPAISPSRDYIALKVINSLLGSGLSSRLFVDLREKQGLAYQVSSMFPSTLKGGAFVMYIGTDPKNRTQVVEGFNTEIKRLQTEPVSQEELERVKSKLVGGFALAHESNASQAFYLSLYETLGVGYQFDTQYPKLVKQVSAADIQRVAQAVFSQPKVMSIVAPQTIRSEASAAP